MNNCKSKTDSTTAKFWDWHIEFIQKHGVKEKRLPLVCQAGGAIYLRLSDRKLVMHIPELIDRFLDNEGRNTKLKDWQFIQIVDAIQKLFTNRIRNLIAPRNSTWRHPSEHPRIPIN
jgi:hypothetical protein